MKQRNPVALRLSRRLQVHMVVGGAAVGAGAGLVVGLFRLALNGADSLMRCATAMAAGNLAAMACWAAAVAVVWAAVCALVHWAPLSAGSGIPQIEANALGRLPVPWARTMLSKFFEGVLCALGGVSVGREGPSVMLGGLCGTAVAKAAGATEGERRLLVTCGAGAGMASAFQAPLTGVMFAVEEVHKSFSAPLVIGTMSAAVTSTFLVNEMIGTAPVISIGFARDLPHVTYGIVLAMGVFLGLLGAGHNRGMFLGQRLYDRIRSHVPASRYGVPCALAVVCAFTAPELLGGGDAILQLLEHVARQPTFAVLVLLLGKYLLTNASAGSGIPGGTLYPLVAMGALAGALFGRGAVAVFGLDPAYVNNFMLLGIAGLFAAVVHAPVTGCLLVFELTGSFSALLSLALVTLVAYVVASLTKTEGYYEHLLEPLVAEGHGAASATPRGHSVVTEAMCVAFGSAAEGSRLSELPLPEGCVCALVERCSRRIVPCADTVLEAADQVLFVMDESLAPEAHDRLRDLLRGTARKAP
ncbi:ClC family H(+)/Cl(-) exchange transporter [Atopobiaceae bacterium 24-176]